MKLKIVRGIAVALIVIGLGLYVYGIAVNGESWNENLARTVIIVLSGVSALMKTFPKRLPLNEYAAAYQKEIGGAFGEDPKKREKLLEAIRLFDEDKYPAAIKVLEGLRLEARTRDEQYAVGLFTALCQTNLGLNEAAIATYEDMAKKGVGSSQLFSNLGARYAALENVEKAMDAYHKAIELDPENPLPHSNIANMVIGLGAYDVAIAAGKRALELNPGQYQAATAVAMAYAALGDDEEKHKYFDMAVKAGQDAKLLERACSQYALRGQAEAQA